MRAVGDIPRVPKSIAGGDQVGLAGSTWNGLGFWGQVDGDSRADGLCIAHLETWAICLGAELAAPVAVLRHRVGIDEHEAVVGTGSADPGTDQPGHVRSYRPGVRCEAALDGWIVSRGQGCPARAACLAPGGGHAVDVDVLAGTCEDVETQGGGLDDSALRDAVQAEADERACLLGAAGGVELLPV